MERKDFLKKSLSFLGIAAVTPLVGACSKTDVDPTTTTTTGSTQWHHGRHLRRYSFRDRRTFPHQNPQLTGTKRHSL